MQMDVGIDELDIPKVQLEQEAQILVEALPDHKYTGKVKSIADEGSSSNGVASFNVTIVLDEIEGLKVGMSAEASIMTAQKQDALYVPVEAVQSSQGKYYVMVPGNASNANAAPEQNASGNPQSAANTPNSGAASQNDQGTQWAQGGQRPQRGQASDQMPGGMSDRIQNMSDEERAAMREQFMASRGNGTANRGSGTSAGTAGVTSTTRVEVEVGINNEDSIEILSGLKEGDLVVLPTVTKTSANANMQAGFPGLGGGITGGIPGGSFTGGNGGGGRQFSGGGNAGGGR